MKVIGGDRHYVNMGGDPLTCGIDGLALDGDTLWIHCGIRRQLGKANTSPDAGHHFGLLPELASNPNDELVTQGAQLFIRASWVFSGSGLACANCHPEGRNDGLSWRLGPEILQTPMLAGSGHAYLVDLEQAKPLRRDDADPDGRFALDLARSTEHRWIELPTAELDEEQPELDAGLRMHASVVGRTRAGINERGELTLLPLPD